MKLQAALRLKRAVDCLGPAWAWAVFMLAALVGAGAAKTLGGMVSNGGMITLFCFPVLFLLLGIGRVITGWLLKKQWEAYAPLFRKAFAAEPVCSDATERIIIGKLVRTTLEPLAQQLDSVFKVENEERRTAKDIVIKTPGDASRAINGFSALRLNSTNAKLAFWYPCNLATLFGYADHGVSYKDYLPEK
jgi:hypothetical protein